ncbi:MAG: hypothetical protein JXR73_20370 [Candidatus Omnitrophica bacterium]|nr:hypothetical protein [Candidatus Omnitrophota bacterium]
MKHTRTSHRCIFGIFCCLILAASSASAQEILHVYPAPGDSVLLQDLIEHGFEWQAPEGAQKFRLYIIGGDIPPNFKVDVETTTYTQIFEQYSFWFKEGQTYTWTIAVLDASNNPTLFSDGAVFQIISDVSLIPTPTPLAQPTPSGDIDGSAFVDHQDMFILSSFWMKTDGSMPAGDLNQDSIINQNDLLVFHDRFGKPGDPPAPVSPIGKPRSLNYSPHAQVTISETPTFEIQWSAPAYPQAGGFVYDILIIRPDGYKIESKGIASTSYKPFKSIITLTGLYSVYLQARLDGVGSSDIVSGQFEIVLFRQAQATPTPVPQTADISGDDEISALDAAVFAKTYNTYKGHVSFNSLADLQTDERIDRNDLLLFQSYYAKRERNLAPPTWISADIPVIVNGIPQEYNSVELITPYELQLGQTDPKLGLAESYYARLTFSAVPGAIDYYITVHYEKRERNLDFFTGGQTTFTEKLIPMGHDEVIAIEVQAAGEGLQLGEKSEALRVIIPPN